MEKFYDTVLARKNVPKDFGGLLPSIAELHEENWEALRKMKPFFTQEEENRKLCWNNNNN